MISFFRKRLCLEKNRIHKQTKVPKIFEQILNIPWDLVTFTEEIYKRKLHLFSSEDSAEILSVLAVDR